MLELQAAELRESLGERKREAKQQRRAQAVQVYFWVSVSRTVEDDGETHATALIAHVRNASLQPIYDVCFIWRVRNTLDVSQVYEESHDGEPLVPGDDRTEFRTAHSRHEGLGRHGALPRQGWSMVGRRAERISC